MRCRYRVPRWARRSLPACLRTRPPPDRVRTPQQTMGARRLRAKRGPPGVRDCHVGRNRRPGDQRPARRAAALGDPVHDPLLAPIRRGSPASIRMPKIKAQSRKLRTLCTVSRGLAWVIRRCVSRACRPPVSADCGPDRRATKAIVIRRGSTSHAAWPRSARDEPGCRTAAPADPDAGTWSRSPCPQ
jgi:hypothetical protein